MAGCLGQKKEKENKFQKRIETRVIKRARDTEKWGVFRSGLGFYGRIDSEGENFQGGTVS